jgi:hypothetical protein
VSKDFKIPQQDISVVIMAWIEVVQTLYDWLEHVMETANVAAAYVSEKDTSISPIVATQKCKRFVRWRHFVITKTRKTTTHKKHKEYEHAVVGAGISERLQNTQVRKGFYTKQALKSRS